MIRLIFSAIIMLGLVLSGGIQLPRMTEGVSFTSSAEAAPPKPRKPPKSKPAKSAKKKLTFKKKPKVNLKLRKGQRVNLRPTSIRNFSHSAQNIKKLLESKHSKASIMKRINRGFYRDNSRNDQFVGRIKGDNKARVELLRNSRSGHVVLQYINKGGLPRGSGGVFLAKTMQAYNIRPKSILMTNIKHERTLDQLKSRIKPRHTDLGRMAQTALKHMGLKAGNMTLRKGRGGNLNLYVEIK